MSAVMMPGQPVADAVFAELVPRIEKLKAGGHTPGLATLLIGGILAALTNLLYADMAVGGYYMEAFSGAIGFTYLIEQVPGIGDADLAKLTITIAFENLAIGIAGAAYIAWLSSIVSKGYSAVQYALVSSLTLLVGTLGRGALGKMIEQRGYHDVFLLTTAIGFFAVALCLVEWWRVSRQSRMALPPVANPETPG